MLTPCVEGGNLMHKRIVPFGATVACAVVATGLSAIFDVSATEPTANKEALNAAYGMAIVVQLSVEQLVTALDDDVSRQAVCYKLGELAINTYQPVNALMGKPEGSVPLPVGILAEQVFTMGQTLASFCGASTVDSHGGGGIVVPAVRRGNEKELLTRVRDIERGAAKMRAKIDEALGRKSAN